MAEETNVEVKMGIDIGDSAAKDMLKLAEATKAAAKAEEEYQKKLKGRANAIRESERMRRDLERMGAIAPPAGPKSITAMADEFAARHRMQNDLKAELVRRGLAKPDPVPTRTRDQMSIAELADERGKEIRRQRLLDAELVRRGLKEPESVKDKGAIHGAASALDVGGWGGMIEGAIGSRAGKAFLAVEVAKAVGEMGINMGKASADPWLSYRQRQDKWWESIPVFGYGKRKAQEMIEYQFTDRGRESLQIAKLQTEQSIRNQGLSEISQVRDSFGRSQSEAQNRAAGFRNFSLDRTAGYDRGTELGRKLVEEESRILPLKQQQRIAATELAVSERNAADLNRKVVLMAADKAEVDRRRMGLVRLREHAESSYYSGPIHRQVTEDLARQEKDLSEQSSILGERLKGLYQQQQGADAAVAENRQRFRQSGIALKQQEFQNLMGREATASSQAQGAIGAGPQGRFEAVAALQMIEQIGIENAPADLQSKAASLFPDRVRRLQEEAAGTVIPGLRASSPEYRDDLQDIRKKADAAREQGFQLQERNMTEFADAIGKSFDGLLNQIVKTIDNKVNKAINDLALDNFIANSSANR